MANMAHVSIQVAGKKEDIEKFVDYLYNIEDNPNSKFFHRTIPQWFGKEEDLENIEETDNKNIYVFQTIIECAWSAEGCLLRKGYVGSEELRAECVDLQEVSNEYNLAIELFSEEYGIGFQEHIICIFGKEILVELIDYTETYNEETEETISTGGYDWHFNSLDIFFTEEGNPISEEEMVERAEELESIKL